MQEFAQAMHRFTFLISTVLFLSACNIEVVQKDEKKDKSQLIQEKETTYFIGTDDTVYEKKDGYFIALPLFKQKDFEEVKTFESSFRMLPLTLKAVIGFDGKNIQVNKTIEADYLSTYSIQPIYIPWLDSCPKLEGEFQVILQYASPYDSSFDVPLPFEEAKALIDPDLKPECVDNTQHQHSYNELYDKAKIIIEFNSLLESKISSETKFYGTGEGVLFYSPLNLVLLDKQLEVKKLDVEYSTRLMKTGSIDRVSGFTSRSKFQATPMEFLRINEITHLHRKGLGYAPIVKGLRDLKDKFYEFQGSDLGVVYAVDWEDEDNTTKDLGSGKGAELIYLANKKAADNAGLEESDIIIEFDGKTVNSVHDLNRFIAKTEKYQKVQVVFLRGSERKTLDVFMSAR